MTASNVAVLFDAGMLRGSQQLAALQALPGSMPLYTDFGEEAVSVGPWLIPECRLSDIRPESWPLPSRLGVSELECQCSLSELQLHLNGIRVLKLDDGQRFYFRFADMRALSAMIAALSGSAALHLLFGPIAEWRHLDRVGLLVTQSAGQPNRNPGANGRPLKLTSKQLDLLLDASLPDHLASAVEELEEADLKPQIDAAQFSSVVRASDYIRSFSIDSFVLQRALAAKAAREGADFLGDSQFLLDWSSLRQDRDPHAAILQWTRDPSRDVARSTAQ